MKTFFLHGLAEEHPNYIHAFESIGAKVLASLDKSKADQCDALLLPGGGDVNPTLYGQTINGSNPPDDVRDRNEIQLITRFLAMERPIFGICRGLQIINVTLGGSLKQHIDGHSQLPSKKDSIHMTCTDDPFLINLYGQEFAVNSAHHQVIDRLGDGLQAIQFSCDGYIEAIRHVSRPITAVQWHPERTCFNFAREDTVDGSHLLKAFISEYI